MQPENPSKKNYEKKELGKNCFLSKLYSMVTNPDTVDVIGWNSEGDGFIIYSIQRLENEVIPNYFKHTNIKSFVRQLNLHGFKKVRVPTKALVCYHDTYKNPFFRKDQMDLLLLIKRRPGRLIDHDEKTQQISMLLEKERVLQETYAQVSAAKESNGLDDIFKEPMSEDSKTMCDAFSIFHMYHRNAEEVPPEKLHVYLLAREFINGLRDIIYISSSHGDISTQSTHEDSPVKAYIAPSTDVSIPIASMPKVNSDLFKSGSNITQGDKDEEKEEDSSSDKSLSDYEKVEVPVFTTKDIEATLGKRNPESFERASNRDKTDDIGRKVEPGLSSGFQQFWLNYMKSTMKGTSKPLVPPSIITSPLSTKLKLSGKFGPGFVLSPNSLIKENSLKPSQPGIRQKVPVVSLPNAPNQCESHQ